jgi:hypothetical protein
MPDSQNPQRDQRIPLCALHLSPNNQPMPTLLLVIILLFNSNLPLRRINLSITPRAPHPFTTRPGMKQNPFTLPIEQRFITHRPGRAEHRREVRPLQLELRLARLQADVCEPGLARHGREVVGWDISALARVCGVDDVE